MTTKKPLVKLFWISYDLGIKGDYESLYTWLDNYGAKECGNSVALVKLPIKRSENPVLKLEKELQENVELRKEDRIYIVWRDVKNGKSLTRGRFLFGNRKRAPWEGYASGHEDNEDDDWLQ